MKWLAVGVAAVGVAGLPAASQPPPPGVERRCLPIIATPMAGFSGVRGVPGQLPPLSSCEWKATPGLVSGGGRFGSVRAGGVSTPELSNAPVET